ncbi:hypothetical protein NGTWS0302_07820 [Mycolicibacterium cyprinidarum]|uniref:SHOCT domain-containing protein n=1 Tax=Mycolicibacterium cyprinidarum TaxID=2860311 RepID=A0ABQ4VC94_9MYCO|nr:hypothetical protein NGTWS1702_35500 [Mycolicibacterium sp. NGTWSNA01]GJF14880.1 hypothetical protein NGTWS0302_07820 [Mycolicibacterium sp. NGTWS0302]GJF19474.1 hypothetical protein NGTWS1803_09370 [Mycolicibacterium sp. NGTWS1803]
MMFWMGHDMSWWGYAGMGIGMLLFWAMIIVGIIALVGRVWGTANAHKAGNAPVPQVLSPEQVLAARFAHGEIDEAEYQQRLAVLHGRAHR